MNGIVFGLIFLLLLLFDFNIILGEDNGGIVGKDFLLLEFEIFILWEIDLGLEFEYFKILFFGERNFEVVEMVGVMKFLIGDCLFWC